MSASERRVDRRDHPGLGVLRRGPSTVTQARPATVCVLDVPPERDRRCAGHAFLRAPVSWHGCCRTALLASGVDVVADTDPESGTFNIADLAHAGRLPTFHLIDAGSEQRKVESEVSERHHASKSDRAPPHDWAWNRSYRPLRPHVYERWSGFAGTRLHHLPVLRESGTD